MCVCGGLIVRAWF